VASLPLLLLHIGSHIIILKGANLSSLSSKKVRIQIQEKLGVDLSSRSKEIDEIIMADIEDKVSSEEEVSEEEADSDTEKKKPKRAAPKKRKTDDDDDWGSSKPKKAAAPAKGRGRGKKSAFTKSFKLSDELADVVGSDVMPRHEVVKKVWQVIKERNLQDPANKQFAICDDQLLKVFGVEKFRTFGMMKYLKDHFLEAA